jgi:hypothetical protein
MYKSSVISLLISICLLGCVSKSDYERVEAELETTKLELSQVKTSYEILLNEKRQEEIRRNSVPYITEEQALGYIDDHFSFYDRDTKYRNVALRRLSDNTFTVAIETCTKKGNFSNDNFFWTSSTRTLTVYPNGKYDF